MDHDARLADIENNQFEIFQAVGITQLLSRGTTDKGNHVSEECS